MNKHQLRIVISTLVITVLLSVTVFYLYRNPGTSSIPFEQSESIPSGKVLLTIDGIYIDKEVPIYENETILKILERVNTTDPNMELNIKEYAGLGAIIDSMYGHTNGEDNRYWIYTINDVMPQVGVGILVPESGDTIRWEFSQSTF